MGRLLFPFAICPNIGTRSNLLSASRLDWTFCNESDAIARRPALGVGLARATFSTMRETAPLLADIYKPELWNSFFTMVGGGVAALTGLVFVALSLNVGEMTSDATHKYRSINTLAGLTAVFVRCGLVLMAGQSHRAVGIDVFVIAALGAISFLYGFRQAFKFEAHPSKQRLAAGTCLYAVELAGALVLIAGSIVGLYMAAVAMLLNVAFMISAAWLLVVGVYSAKVKA